MLIDLNDEEANQLIGLLDLAVKQAGIQSVTAVNLFLNKIQSAKQRENAGPVPEEEAE